MEGPALIRFDRKTWGFLGFLLILFSLATVFKLHGSSLGVWNLSYPDRNPRDGVLLGTPKSIRSDEWGVSTLEIISQAHSLPPFSATNRSWGPERVPLITNLPVRHWSAMFRPQYWGFFLLDLEHAFSFFWNTKAFLFLSGLFMVLMLFTGNNFGISLFGTAWMFFSGFIQWWYSTPAALPEMVGYTCLLLVATHYLVFSPQRWLMCLSTFIISICLFNFILSFYPPFQVPLLYFGSITTVGSLSSRLRTITPMNLLKFRLACAACAVMTILVLVVLYYREAKPTIEIMRGTVYPGSRQSLGGEVSFVQVFGGFYGFFMSEQKFPQGWSNVCEASNFILLFPVPMIALFWQAWRKQTVSLLEWSLIIYILLIVTWMTVGFPRPIAAASALSLTRDTRSLLGLGLASICLCCIFMARRSAAALCEGFGLKFIATASMLCLLVYLTWQFNRITQEFLSFKEAVLVCIIPPAAGFLLLSQKRIAFAACILIPSILAFAPVNPLAIGLGPVLQTTLFKQVSQLVEQDPDARWIVYGNYGTADFLKTTGAHVFNGTKVLPPLEDFRVIDPGSTAISVYNRYAHIGLFPQEASFIAFTLRRRDFYKMQIDPGSDLWRQIGIRYVVLPFIPTNDEFLNKTELVQALPAYSLWIYRYRWGTAPLTMSLH